MLVIMRYTGSVKWVGSMEEVKKNKKILYYFAVFAVVNKLLINY